MKRVARCGLGVVGSDLHKQGAHRGDLEVPNKQRGSCVCMHESGRVLYSGGIGQ